MAHLGVRASSRGGFPPHAILEMRALLERDNYWNRQINRRRALLGAGTAGVGAVALGLVGCGSDNSGDANPEATANPTKQAEAKSMLWNREDTSAKVVKGGMGQIYWTLDFQNLDPLSSPSYTANTAGCWYYPRLLSFKPGHKAAATGEVEGYLANTWEQPDTQTVVMHIRPNALWEPRAPLNGRAITADDVVFSWNKFAAKGASRLDLVNLPTNPNGPISSVTAIDKSTVQFKLAFPYSPILSALAYSRYLQIMPSESESGGYDPRNETRSGGPWIMESYQRNVGFVYKKNPNYWDKDNVYLDGYDVPIIAEAAAQMAQFRAKKIWSYAPPSQDDVIPLHKDLPELQIDANTFNRYNWMTYFGLQPGSPFLDARVRRAASMLLDRDAWIDAFYNTTKFKAEGFPQRTRWNSHISGGWESLWVDPKGQGLGEGAANFQYNVAEAKKLLSAAGVSTPIETDISWISSGEYGTAFPKNAEVFKGMFEADGLFKLKQVNPAYTEYVPKVYYAKGDFKGIAVGATTTYPEIDQFLFAYYHSQGSRQKVAYQGQGGDATSDKMIEQQRAELDPAKRTQIIKDWQKYIASTMPMIPFPGQAESFTLFWPWAANTGVFRAFDPTESDKEGTYTKLWFDKSKYTG